MPQPQPLAKRPREDVFDPDETLVEPERPVRLKRYASESTASSSEATSQASSAADENTDLSMWRNSLQPHQTNLFDELVNVSHRLVAYLSNTEVAAQDFVEDYRRRGIRLIEEMEASHASQYEEYLASVDARKNHLRTQLDSFSQKLNNATAPVAAAKDARRKRKAKGHDLVGKMQQILESYCRAYRSRLLGTIEPVQT